MTATADLFKRGLVLFWAGWLTLVLGSNLFDAFHELGWVGDGFHFVSGNFGLIEETTAIYEFPGWLNGLLFAGVIAWEALGAALLWWAFLRYRDGGTGERVLIAFAVPLGLWAAFVLADELFIAYQAGLEATHLRVFIAQLVTLLVIFLLPGPAARVPGGHGER